MKKLLLLITLFLCSSAFAGNYHIFWHSNNKVHYKSADSENKDIRYIEVSRIYAKLLTDGNRVIEQHCGNPRTCRALRGYAYIKNKLAHKKGKYRYVVLYHRGANNVKIKARTNDPEEAFDAYHSLGKRYAKVLMKDGWLKKYYNRNYTGHLETVGYYRDYAGSKF